MSARLFRLARLLLRLAVALLPIAGAALPAFADQLTFDLDIRHGNLPASMRLIRVKQGDVVTLRCTTDQPIVLHLHGYDIERRIIPGPPAEMTFTASATGRFPVHVHAQGVHGAPAHADESLADVEVWPR